MKIDRPGGGYKIPEPPDSGQPDRTRKKSEAGFERQLGAAEGGSETDRPGPVENQAPTETERLRDLIGPIDGSDPEAVRAATDKIVDHVLREALGERLLNTDGAEDLKAAVREQILNDPLEAARLQRIFKQL